MTKNKRFEFREVNFTAIVPKVYDTKKQQYANLFECVHWLNDLSEENEQLKIGINSLKLLVQNWEALDEEKDEQIDRQSQALKKLKKENEQLKSKNRGL